MIKMLKNTFLGLVLAMIIFALTCGFFEAILNSEVEENVTTVYME